MVPKFANIFSQSLGFVVVVVVYGFLVEQNLVSLISSYVSIFTFIFIALGDWPKKTLPRFMSENTLPKFSSKSFMVNIYLSL